MSIFPKGGSIGWKVQKKMLFWQEFYLLLLELDLKKKNPFELEMIRTLL
jgi:hypothetical protein